MPVPVSETIWRGKGGTPEKCACIVIMPVSGVPVSGIYCIFVLNWILIQDARDVLLISREFFTSRYVLLNQAEGTPINPCDSSIG